MSDPPVIVWLVLAGGVVTLGVLGLRGALALRDSLRGADLRALDDPPNWRVTRAAFGLFASLPVLLTMPGLGGGAFLAAGVAGALGFAVAPLFLASVRDGVEREILDDLPVHLDLMALTMESGGSLPAALAIAAEHGPAGALQRALETVLLDVHAGTEPLEALRALDQRLGLRGFSTLVTSLRSAERLGMPVAVVLRERATQSAANRFARAERQARAAPLKLWATLVLCIAPCTLIVLAFPMARLLFALVGR
ncbi:MAG TPA: type II secretion system F family protein [Steroidobacteraceae bacterium]|nr:type II secretion system F family protein [Steroidobacteraceae bacterium]